MDPNHHFTRYNFHSIFDMLSYFPLFPNLQYMSSVLLIQIQGYKEQTFQKPVFQTDEKYLDIIIPNLSGMTIVAI